MSVFSRKIKPATPINQHSGAFVAQVVPSVEPSPGIHNPEMNVPAIHDQPVYHYERVLLNHLLSGQGLLEAVRDALLQSSEKLREEQEALEGLQHKNDSAKQCMEKLKFQVQQITEGAQQELSDIEQLQVSLASIHQCVSDINRISRQTDLLAINSAIEAAHVGVDGRGFTVIAKEIKTLSAEVQQQSASIVSLTHGIADDAKKLCENVAEQVPMVKQMHEDIHEAGLLLNQVVLRSTRMQDIIHFICTQQFLNTVKMDHVIWKYQVYRYLFDQNENAQVNMHTECRLGKWYYGSEATHYAVYPAFANIEQPHASVHKAGREALAAFFANDFARMEHELENMESASHQVVSVIDNLIEQLREHWMK